MFVITVTAWDGGCDGRGIGDFSATAAFTFTIFILHISVYSTYTHVGADFQEWRGENLIGMGRQ